MCAPANINSPEQIVISGNTDAVKRGAKLASERGARLAKLLPVSAPFHCSLMKPAQDRLEADLNALRMQRPVYPVACNVEASLVTDELRARSTLVAQVTGSVKWAQSMQLLIERGVQTFLEIGPGKVLCVQRPALRREPVLLLPASRCVNLYCQFDNRRNRG